MAGKKQNLDLAFNYLERKGVRIQSLAHDIKWYEKRCIHCTACISICSTNALFVDRGQ
jgi:ferredoxin